MKLSSDNKIDISFSTLILKIANFKNNQLVSNKHPLFGTKYSRMDQVKFFKSCLPQILLGSFLNTLSYLFKHENINPFIR